MTVHDPSAFHGKGGAPPAPPPPPSPAQRKGVAAAAGHLGDEATVRAALADEDPTVRAAAVSALARLGTATLADLERAFADEAPGVRRRAAEIAWRTSVPADELGELVSRQLEDGEGEVVEAACFCLGELRHRPAVTALHVVAAEHGDPLCRESAVAALGAIGDPSSLPVVLAALADRSQIRRRAVLALAAYEGPEVDAALEAAMKDRDWQVRQAAEDLTSSRASDG